MENSNLGHKSIIERLGGVRPLARLLGHRNPTTVQGWADRGVIPSRQQQAVLIAARNSGVALTPADFFNLDSISSTEVSEPAAVVGDQEAA
jgi:hypothetical protein